MLYFKNKKNFFLTLVTFITTISAFTADNHSIFEENITCKENQTSEFPQDLFSEAQRKCGAIILHVIFSIYSFGTIALVCSERFLPVITCICEDLKLSDDVAAATFMSIASSAPELFSNFVGTFITESDIGIGHVIGNGYYNMFFVAALGGFAAKKEIVLEWWPLTRDCNIYAVVTLVLTGIVWDGVIQIYEAVLLILLYFIYFFIMFNNKKIINIMSQKFNTKISISQSEMAEINKNTAKKEKDVQEKGDPEETESLNSENNFRIFPPPVFQNPKAENERWTVTKKIFMMPISFLITYTIPDVRKNKFRKYYSVVFVLCVVWIGASTYLGTWMISVIGETIGVSDLVMGMTFMAAGGSVVEAYSVYYKTKRGECKIGLSNSMGCNNLDITLGLALPWFIKTLPIHTSLCGNDSSGIFLESSLIHINCLLLVISVTALYIIFFINKFKLNKKLGLICGGMYVIILYIGISVEKYGASVKRIRHPPVGFMGELMMMETKPERNTKETAFTHFDRQENKRYCLIIEWKLRTRPVWSLDSKYFKYFTRKYEKFLNQDCFFTSSHF